MRSLLQWCWDDWHSVMSLFSQGNIQYEINDTMLWTSFHRARFSMRSVTQYYEPLFTRQHSVWNQWRNIISLFSQGNIQYEISDTILWTSFHRATFSMRSVVSSLPPATSTSTPAPASSQSAATSPPTWPSPTWSVVVSLSVCLSAYLSFCLSLCLTVSLPMYLLVRLSVLLSVCLHVWLSVCHFVSLPACLSVCLFICLPLCPWVCGAVVHSS